MRLIDADALLKKISRMIDYCQKDSKVNGLTALFQVGDAIMDCKSVDAVEVVHGRWEECDWVEYDGHGECIHYPNAGCVCTNCRNAFKKEFINNPRVNYCPNCGANMMDGEENG